VQEEFFEETTISKIEGPKCGLFLKPELRISLQSGTLSH
jgi:hypothetical protein